MQLENGGLGDQFVVHVLDLDHDTAVHRLVFVGMVVLFACGVDDAGNRQEVGGDEHVQLLHGYPFSE